MPSDAHLTSLQFNMLHRSASRRYPTGHPDAGKQMERLPEVSAMLKEGERGPEQPEDEWGITDDDGSGGGGSKEDYEDFDFEGDDW